MSIRAGTAVRQITPEGAVPLFGFPRKERLSTGQHDPLLASALHFRSGSGDAIILALDLLFLPPPASRAIRAAVASGTGITEDMIFVGCTHTHSGPVTGKLLSWLNDPTLAKPNPDYLDQVKTRAVQAAAEAAATSRPTEIAWLGLQTDLGAGLVVQADVLVLREPDGGAIFGMAVVGDLAPAVLNEESTSLSSDFPHYLREQIHRLFGPKTVALYFVAPSAGRPAPRDLAQHTFEEAERIGRRLADAIAAQLQKTAPTAFSSEPVLAGRRAGVGLPLRAFPRLWDAQMAWGDRNMAYEKMQKEGADPARLRAARDAVLTAEGTVTLIRAAGARTLETVLSTYPPIEVQVLRVGDACLAGLPGMLAPEYGGALRKSAARRTACACLVNGDLQGSIVTADAAKAGAYTVMNSPFAPEAGQKLLDTALAVIARL
ncbi:MAG: hypothetical protein JXR37_34460 [Kiritimatiellae bacterium]|nr:hypothetical protein [Kiritimatiellia bacterium]